jgi:hypothetical protein
MYRLLTAQPEVLALMDSNPFPDAAPRYIRARLYQYEFTSSEEKKQTGAWWSRRLAGEYLEPVSLSAEGR